MSAYTLGRLYTVSRYFFSSEIGFPYIVHRGALTAILLPQPFRILFYTISCPSDYQALWIDCSGK